MALAALAQRAALAAFGQAATVEIDGRAHAVAGIFHAAHALVEVVQDAAYSTVRPVLLVRADDLPQTPAEGDAASVAGSRWRIVDVRPDGLGMLKLVLQAA